MFVFMYTFLYHNFKILLDDNGKSCSSDMFWCENGPCIQRSLRCDGTIDCPYDTSDELDCQLASCKLR